MVFVTSLVLLVFCHFLHLIVALFMFSVLPYEFVCRVVLLFVFMVFFFFVLSLVFYVVRVLGIGLGKMNVS